MTLLIISIGLPQPDRASGDYRFFQILRLLTRRFEVRLCARWIGIQQRLFGEAILDECVSRLQGIGVEVVSKSSLEAVQAGGYDVVLFEFYNAARGLIDEVRFRCPQALVVIDSVDVHFARELMKARLTGNSGDLSCALETKSRELAAYRSADLVIAVSQQDEERLLAELPDLRAVIVPNLHTVPAFSSSVGKVPNQLLFVGGFRFSPNEDAVLWLVSEILPLIRDSIPNVHLVIAGDSPPPAVCRLASETVTVHGFVPDLGGCYQRAAVSVAPLRYGGGMKGKVGEAMAYGLPVVTTSVGAEGFGFRLNHDVLVGDSPATFAAAVVSLLQDRRRYEQVRYAGWRFIHDHYSVDAVAASVFSIFEGLATIAPKRLPIYKRMYKSIPVSVRSRLWGRASGRK